MDEPLFLWAARWIQSSPTDFYGFNVNWYGFELPMFKVAQNPPLTSYFIALVTHFFGWHEAILHLTFFLFAAAAITGTYFLAREFCSSPLIAALTCLVSPGFLLASTTIMCDTMMLSLWVWAVYFWVRGMKEEKLGFLIAAAVLAAAASLTKYYGMSLIALFFAYSLAWNGRLGKWTAVLAVSVLILIIYQVSTYLLYGRGLLREALKYVLHYNTVALNHNSGGISHFFTKTLTGLSFTGGCFLAVFFYALQLWRKRTVSIAALLMLMLVAGCFFLSISNWFRLTNDGIDWSLFVQVYLFALTGFGILFLSATDLWKRRDADSLLLFLWIMGTFVFASYLNWAVNGRSVLPAAPAVGILIVRRFEDRTGQAGIMTARWRMFVPLVLSLAVALLVAGADYELADMARTGAIAVNREYHVNQKRIRFLGHWGFQYYMEAEGAKPLEVSWENVDRGDIVVAPTNNTNVYPLPARSFTYIKTYLVSASSFAGISSFVGIMQSSLGAGFYSDFDGPLPFAFGQVPPEKYRIYSATGLMTPHKLPPHEFE